MCGIAGILGTGGRGRDLLRRMGDALRHRGPDDAGIWTDPDADIGFTHRRLSIVDLSPHGHQPMASADGRWVVTYNGEIYNHPDLRRWVEAEAGTPQGGWRGHSDTEVLLEAISAFGLDAALHRMVGMFAFALWDRQLRQLHLVRDRFGEKPLYVGAVRRNLLFASELKAFKRHPDFEAEIDHAALSALIGKTYIPAPRSIYRRTYKLLPGTVMTLSEGFDPAALPEPPTPGYSGAGISYRRYWSYRDVVVEGARRPFEHRAEAIDAVDMAIANAIAGQSVADVPIGAFLSGGIDSSIVASLYQRSATRPISTFTIGFSERDFDESPHAAAIARHLGTDHHEMIVTPAEAREVIPQLPTIYDEPFADSSQIPTYLVSRFARRSVTVALSGDGGDELFTGYNRHVLGSKFWRTASRLPAGVRKYGAGALALLPTSLWSVGTAFAPRGPAFGERVRKGLRLAADARSLKNVHDRFLDQWYGHRSPLRAPWNADAVAEEIDASLPPATQLAYWDAIDYLPDDILVKVDRAAMAVSLEGRMPFLDHRVAEVAARVPESMKLDGRGGKAILRDVLAREIPPSLFERPKTGFGIPVGEWLRGPLREWAEELLDARALSDGGYFDAQSVRDSWQDHLDEKEDRTPALWAILMFEAWRRQV